MESTCFARGKSATVSVPMPGPTSSTLSSSHTSESLQMFAITASFTKKFCPSECFVAKPWRESTSRVAPTDAKCDAIAIEFPFLRPRCSKSARTPQRSPSHASSRAFRLPKTGASHGPCHRLRTKRFFLRFRLWLAPANAVGHFFNAPTCSPK